MLEMFRVSNFAIIDVIELELCQNLTVITGETGAGKSIVLGAMRMLLGERATSDVVRAGSARAGIEGLFTKVSDETVQWTLAHDFQQGSPDEERNVLIRREILAEGNSRNYINGKSATVSQLRELGMQLVDMHSQDDHTSLYQPGTQLRLLDSFGGYTGAQDNYRRAYEQWQVARNRFDGLSSAKGDGEKHRDFLRFQVTEIEQAELVPGEDELLADERKRLGNAEKLQELCASARQLVYENDNDNSPAGQQLISAVKLLNEIAQTDPTQTELAKEAESIRFALEDLGERLRDYSDSVEGDPKRLDVIENRLEQLRSLKRKYGATLDEVIGVGQTLRAELDDLENYDEAYERAANALTDAEGIALQAGMELRAMRKASARKFEKLVVTSMHDLELPKAALEVRLTETEISGDGSTRPTFAASGIDSCEILVSLNAGESVKPLRKIASGGEVSRIMLAIKGVLAGRDHVSTLVFDEIDTGISGKAAARVGERLRKLSESHQVICITHLPQVAARGHRHLVVNKRAEGNRTSTSIAEVAGEERTLALARMLSGDKVDETTRKFAEQLLVQ